MLAIKLCHLSTCVHVCSISRHEFELFRCNLFEICVLCARNNEFNKYIVLSKQFKDSLFNMKETILSNCERSFIVRAIAEGQVRLCTLHVSAVTRHLNIMHCLNKI